MAAITDHWGGLDLSSFSQRLLLQKRMFFASLLGIDLGYGHSWYIRGPYSSSLTRDAFEVWDDQRAGGTVKVSLPVSLSEKIENIRALFGAYWDQPKKMELLSSICFLAQRFNTKDPKILRDKLTTLKRQFTEADASFAIDWLRERGLLNV